jgi:hypothetical protein
MKPYKNCSGKSNIIIMGIALGVLLAVSSVFLVLKNSDKVLLEKDVSHTLGLTDDKAPEVALRPWNVDELSQKLKANNVEQLMKSAAALADRVTVGFLPSDWDQTCKAEHPETLCVAVADYFEKQAGVFSIPSNKQKKKKFPLFDVRFVKDLQKEEFSILLSRLPDWDKSKMKKFTQAALETSECPKNFSLALARKWEVHLNSEVFSKRQENVGPDNVWHQMRSLEKQGLECLSKEDPGSEFAFFKAALWDLLDSNENGAILNFERALLSTQRKEEYRVRYWYMRTLKKLGKESEYKLQSKLLKDKFPISFHTLLTKTDEGEDPLTIFQEAAYYSDKNETEKDLINIRFFWLLTLLELENVSFAVKRYGEFFIRSLGEDMDPAMMQFLARSFDRMGYHRLQIVALNQIVIHKPTKVNLETLRLLFPRPFLDQLDRLSPQVDIALLLGLARQESGFDPSATSGVNARGLLQVLPSTAKGVRKKIQAKELYDYEKNIDVGAKYLLRLIQMFGGSVEKSLAAYNAGQGTLKKWEQRYGFIEDPIMFLDSMPYRETRDYVPSIVRNAFWYHRLFPSLRVGFEEKGAVTSEILKDLVQRAEKSQGSN